MREIDKVKTAEILVRAIELRPPAELYQLNLPLTDALQNNRGIPFNIRGIEMCLADEVLPLIVHAHKGLSDKVSPAVFAQVIAGELDAFAKTFSDQEHPLTYPHFLLHGISQPTVEKVIEKIRDNVRIIRQPVPEELISKRFTVPEVGDMFFGAGSGDDFHGYSLRLYSDKSSPEAKVGFFVDQDNKTAYLINVQRRKLYEHPVKAVETNAERKVRQLNAHREFAQLCGHLAGKDPREFVISNLVNIFRESGITLIKALKSEHHPMSIADHPGFKGGYNQYFISAGISEDLGIYLGLKLT